MNLKLRIAFSGLLFGTLLPLAHATIAAPVICPRYAAGSALIEPKDLFSNRGILRVTFNYETRVDSDGNTLYCFMTPDGTQSPTLHVRPGDELLITLNNNLPMPASGSAAKHGMAGMKMDPITIPGQPHDNCGGMVMTDTSVNLHYHGTNTPPVCHQDEVIKTLINSGESFNYDVHFPLDEPPGLYWYHPHIHGISEPAVQGGATGAIVVEGIENVNREAARLPERVLVFRDNLVPGTPPDGDIPAWDLSLNYVPVAYPNYTPVKIGMKTNEKQLWRVVNTAADTILDLEVQYDGVTQPLDIVGIDGVPTGSQDGTSEGRTLTRNHFRLATAARVEFVLAGPPAGVKHAVLLTRSIDTGPYGDNDPRRVVATIVPSAPAPSLTTSAAGPTPVSRWRFNGLAEETPVRKRKLYFSEVLSDPSDPASPTNFFITVDGATPKLFDPNNPPAIVTTQGSVEDWTIENRAEENHEFHIHQIHFLVIAKDGKPVDGQYRDMIDVPYWSGTGPYPSVTLRMDFRGPDIGDFVYHCHILGHEDNGMMAVIRVLPRR
ncbi:MAG TPA: multicopper oxidase domain-containing protein [Acidobacteriaceae bacterium]|nr:multicopper oxidase domain-containing protein [Acidobacteriaceae bacterium]